ncbi:MAG TPA: hypothetical protein VIH59_27875 [Candidatus Tectomicrobia bacterium]
MRRGQQVLRCAGVVIALAVLTSCTYEAAIRQLPPPEREMFRIYSKAMTGTQIRTYLARGTAAERAAYLDQIGITQRFQALDPQDREVVLSGYAPRKGMSAEALRFLWGEPVYTKGQTGRYEYWYYLGPFMELAAHGNVYSKAGVQVEVYLVAGRVDSWIEFAPDVDTDDSNSGRRD